MKYVKTADQLSNMIDPVFDLWNSGDFLYVRKVSAKTDELSTINTFMKNHHLTRAMDWVYCDEVNYYQTVVVGPKEYSAYN